MALVYGFAMLGFALLWTVIALAITIRTAREHLPFSLDLVVLHVPRRDLRRLA
ncbi:hypothetical protein QP157_21070 [Sphingomonas sp. LR61]